MNSHLEKRHLLTYTRQRDKETHTNSVPGIPQLLRYIGLWLAGLALIGLTGCTVQTATASADSRVTATPQSMRHIEVAVQETLQVSVANVNDDVALAEWLAAGWAVGDTIGKDDAIPPDCGLHAREGIARQFFAACIGPMQLTIPSDAGDFIYLVLAMGRINKDATPH